MILPTPRSDVLIRRYAVVAYLLLTMAMGTGTITLVVRNYFPGGAALKAATSASASGIFLTALTKGIAGLKLLFSQLFIWRVGIANWFFAALLIIPIIFLGSLFNPIFNGDAPKLSKFELGFDWILMYLSFFPVAE